MVRYCTRPSPGVDLFGRVVRSAIKRGAPSDVVTSYGYNPAGRLTSITSPRGALTSYSYDWLGRRTQTVDPDAGTSTASYRPGGQVSYSRDGAGLESWSTVDGVGRVTLVETGPAASKVTAMQNVYDTALKGTLASATRYTGGNAYTEATAYDVRYRPSAVTRTVPGPLMGGATGTSASWTTSMTYDGMDRPTSTTYPAANGLPAETVTSTYTVQGYGYQVSPSLTGVPRYVGDTVHTNIGQLSYRLRGDWATTGSVQQSFWYDAATARMTGAWARTPSGSSTDNVQSQTFSYANTGEVTAVVNNVDNQREMLHLRRPVPAHPRRHHPDRWGGRERVHPGHDHRPHPYKETYAYDDDGSMTSLVRSTSPTAATTIGYTYGATTLGSTALAGGPHALTKVTTNAAATSGYGYDGAGRQTTVTNGAGTAQAASTRTWNALGQPATVGGTANTFTDGPDGSRWVRTATNGVGTTTTTVYLPGQDVSRSVTSGGAATLSGVRYYTAHDGEVVATRTPTGGNGTLTWVLSNYQSSNTTAINSTTSAITRDRYTPYGLNRATTTNTGYALPGVTGSDRGWIGRPRDDGTGLNQLGARYYDPNTAHFISPDPLNVQESPQAANPYTYANDNPTTLSDPTGLAATDYWYRRVQPGDNWNKIAAGHNVTLDFLRSINGGSLNALQVATTIRVGIRSVSSTPSTASAAKSSTTVKTTGTAGSIKKVVSKPSTVRQAMVKKSASPPSLTSPRPAAKSSGSSANGSWTLNRLLGNLLPWGPNRTYGASACAIFCAGLSYQGGVGSLSVGWVGWDPLTKLPAGKALSKLSGAFGAYGSAGIAGRRVWARESNSYVAAAAYGGGVYGSVGHGGASVSDNGASRTMGAPVWGDWEGGVTLGRATALS